MVVPRHSRLIPARLINSPLDGKSYLLQDEFTIARGTGAIDQTPADGSGLRTVIDTGSKLSISGGQAVFVSGTAGSGDPGLWLSPSVVRAFGRMMFARVTTPSSLSSVVWQAAWDSGQSGGAISGIRGTGSSLQILNNGLANAGTYATIAISKTYDLCVLLRATGYLAFFRDVTVAGLWLLLGIIPDVTTTPLFPCIQVNSTGGPLLFDKFRVPNNVYNSIAPMAYGAFGGGTGPLGLSDVVGPDGQVVVSRAWVDQVGTWAISGGVATASALSGGLAIATVPTVSADAHIRIALTRAGGSVGGVARYQDANNYLRFSHDGTNVLCEQVVSGTPSTLRTGAATFVSGAIIYLKVVDTTGFLFYNNAQIGASFTVPASTQVNHGLYTTNTGNGMDAFEVWANGGGNEFSQLNSFLA